MKQKHLLTVLSGIAILVNVFGIYQENFWLRVSGQAFFILPLAAYYFKKLPYKNINFYVFLFCIITTSLIMFFGELWYFNQITLGLLLLAYIALAREAIKHTEYERGSKFTTFYFILIVAIYGYLLSNHILEIEEKLANNFELSFYIIYYLNILFIAIAALIYYLNSFSKKSVFFICLTLSFIFADILRDMEVFYFPDLSVEIVESLIRFAALKLVFLFFITPEKKLRLLHLV